MVCNGDYYTHIMVLISQVLSNFLVENMQPDHLNLDSSDLW